MKIRDNPLKFLGYHSPKIQGEELDIDETARAVYGHMEDLKNAQKTLLDRPLFSVRKQIYVGNILIFFMALIMVFMVVINNDQIQKRLRFLEFVNNFAVEIQQARRYEKNYFLYGTNLNDAIENIHLAESIFKSESEQFSELLGGSQTRREILSKISSYESLLGRLYKQEQTLELEPGARDSVSLKNIELQLRGRGKEILTTAQRLMAIEKQTLEKTLNRARYVHMISIVGLLIFLALNTYLLVTRLYRTLNRFAAYAKRIAKGDFSPITPQRRFRDEFTDLAVSINDMIREIDTREAVLIQTHKLKAVGTLTAGVAHELNNPLNNIMLTVHMLIEELDDLAKEEILEMLNDVVEETDRSKKIIRNLLDFARESSSTMESLSISRIINDTVRLLENQIRFSGTSVEIKLAENLPKIQGDIQKLTQVFVNLILNALYASGTKGRIQIIGRIGEKGDTVMVSVIDYGCGIPKHILSSIFDPFFTTKEKGKGTGLGLSVSQGIIAKHGGKITVTSEEGSGSSFTVIFPIIGFSSTEPVIE